MRCVRVGYVVERLMKTDDNGVSPVTDATTHDIDWKLRKYSVTTGWAIPSVTATAVPGKQDFAPIVVDFS